MTCLRLLICPLICRDSVTRTDNQASAYIAPADSCYKGRGPVSGDLPMESVVLMLKRSTEREAALEQLLADQQNSASLHYHEWLTPEQFGQRIGPSQQR